MIKDLKVRVDLIIFDLKLWKEAKKLAIDKDMTVSELIEDLIEKELEKE